MKLFIIQSISSFVANDYESGVHYLKEVKQAYAEHMGTLNPTLKNLAKEIIQAVDLFNPNSSSGFVSGTMSNASPDQPASSPDADPSMPSFGDEDSQSKSQSAQQEQPRSVASELQELLRKRKEKRRK